MKYGAAELKLRPYFNLSNFRGFPAWNLPGLTSVEGVDFYSESKSYPHVPKHTHTHARRHTQAHIGLYNDAKTDKEGKSRLTSTRMVMITTSSASCIYTAFSFKNRRALHRYYLTNPQGSFLKAALSRLSQWRK